MEIITNKNSHLSIDENSNINDTLDAIVCALILEGWHVETIRKALLGKAESMYNEFNLATR